MCVARLLRENVVYEVNRNVNSTTDYVADLYPNIVVNIYVGTAVTATAVLAVAVVARCTNICALVNAEAYTTNARLGCAAAVIVTVSIAIVVAAAVAVSMAVAVVTRS